MSTTQVLEKQAAGGDGNARALLVAMARRKANPPPTHACGSRIVTIGDDRWCVGCKQQVVAR